MRKYNFLQALGLSFYSKDLYRDVAKNWGARVILYLFMLICICSALQIFVVQHQINKYMQESGNAEVDNITAQMPAITLKGNGTIETTENKPYFIYTPNGKQILLVIDTSSQYITLENQPFDILFTKTKYMVRKNNGGIQMTNWPTGIDFTVYPNQAKTAIKDWVQRLWMVLFPLILVPFFLWRLIVTGVYAAIGKIFAKMLGLSLSYYTLFSLAVIALTPVMILNIIFQLTDLIFPYRILFFFILGLAYLFFAVYANKRGEYIKN